MKKIIFLLITIFSSTIFATAQTATTDKGVEINGVIWATRNVNAPGTFVANSEDAGMFYQWNSNVGWTAAGVPSDGTSVWNKYWNGNGAETWETANNVCPTGWHIPTKEEFESLIAAGGKWTAEPANGYRFGSGDNSVFFPAASLYDYTGGDFWSSSTDGTEAYLLTFWDDGESGSSNVSRLDTGTGGLSGNALGLSIRCAKNGANGIDEVSMNTKTATIAGYYSILGEKLPKEPVSGIYIVRYDNGKTEKVVKQPYR